MLDTNKFIQNWLTVANAFDTEKFVKLWHQNAILDDPSVGQVFKGHQGIRTYFEDYFIGYKTQTQLIKLFIISDSEVHLEVEFTGTFSDNKIGGKFEITFKDDKIAKAKAELI